MLETVYTVLAGQGLTAQFPRSKTNIEAAWYPWKHKTSTQCLIHHLWRWPSIEPTAGQYLHLSYWSLWTEIGWKAEYLLFRLGRRSDHGSLPLAALIKTNPDDTFSFLVTFMYLSKIHRLKTNPIARNKFWGLIWDIIFEYFIELGLFHCPWGENLTKPKTKILYTVIYQKKDT